IGLAAVLQFDADRVKTARLAFLAAGERPVLAHKAMAALAGSKADDAAISAAQQALDADLDPPGDLQADPATKKHLARVLLGRCVQQMRQAA
ncbi:MAG: xanthine dehydrogenase family protein subunit M, partial [Quisquiliibacterium sp.]